MMGFKTHGLTAPKASNQPAKKKFSEKDKQMVTDAIKKLSQDNVLLKSAVRKLVEKDDRNHEKVAQFDKLAQAYNKLSGENAKLKNAVDVLSYAARDKCQDIMFDHSGNNDDSYGGSGVF